MFLVSSHSTCAILRECVLKYDKNSYAKIVTIWTYCGTTVSGDALCVYRLRYNSVFLHKWKINLLKQVLKKSSCLSLIECLGENMFLIKADIDDFCTFIQTVPYDKTIYESCVKTRMSIHGDQKTKNSMTLPPDPDVSTQVILRVQIFLVSTAFFHFSNTAIR